MITGRVTGSIYATIQHPSYEGRKLMIVECIGTDSKLSGDYLVAVDTVGAGPGERVLVLDEGNGARQILGSTTAPIRSIIVGIIDEITV